MWKISSTVCPTVIEFRLSTANYFLMDYSNTSFVIICISKTGHFIDHGLPTQRSRVDG